MHLNDRILAVDDNVDNLAILEELLGGEYTLRCAINGEDALRVAPEFKPNLVLLDLMMPGLNGHETCDLLRRIPELAAIKIVMVSARRDVRDRLSAYDAGAVDYISKPFHEQEVLAKVRTWMKMIHAQHVEGILQEIDRTREVVGTALVNLASFRDAETGDHLFRLRWYSHTLAEHTAMFDPYRRQIDEQFLQQLYRASPLHDIGKVGIDDAILRKPGPLTPAEFEVIKRHTVIGADILSRAAEKLPHADYLKMAVQVARHHHERWDGGGYPDGLAGEAIPLAARIVAVADVFDALTSDRVYKRAMAASDAANIIEDNSGSQFDPSVVDAFRSRFEEFRQAQGRCAAGVSMSDGELVGASSPSNWSGVGVDHVEHALIL
ncbi:MAG TPA: HD domain-containing phosphohydrolase [Pirellulales bacterium]|jgi:putative two-component system response regulator|nr:HD domain-containing phosphohydrolase [Pirellulales bacterium]